MQHLAPSFLTTLQDKLTLRDLHSIHLDALPKQYLTRLDMADLDQVSVGLSQTFLDQLLQEAVIDFPIDLPKDASANFQRLQNSLDAITFEQQNYYEEHGAQTFGFGYPILLFKDPQQPERIIKAPLIIWSLDIQRDLEQPQRWWIRQRANFAVETNRVLTTYLKHTQGVKLHPTYSDFLEDHVLDKDELAEMLHLQMKQLNPNLADRTRQMFRELLDKPLSPLKTAEAIKQLPLDKPAILWSGLFGLYKAPKEGILADLDYLVENLEQLQPLIEEEPNPSNPNKSSFMKHSFTMLPMDPCQQQVLYDLDKGQNIVLQGAPGTGKSHTLAAIAANVLSNAGTCLVVCEHKTAIDDIYNMLKKVGLEEIVAPIEDVYRDRPNIVQSVRHRSQQQHPPYRVPSGFIRLFQSCEAHVQRLQGFHNKMQQPIVGAINWSNTIGWLLQQNQQASTQQLHKILNPKQFSFSNIELDAILSILPEGKQLFDAVGSFNHPLNVLEDHFFEAANALQVEEKIRQVLEKVRYVVQSAQRDAFTYLFEYETLLDEHFSKVYTSKMNLVEDLIERIEIGLKQDPYHFNKQTGFYRKLVRQLSDKHKKIEAEKVSILQQFIRLQRVQKQFNYFQFNFMDISKQEELEFSKLLEHLQEYKGAVYDWYEARGAIVQQLVRELGPGKVYRHVSFDKKVRVITQSLEVFQQNFGQSNVFKAGFQFANKNIRQRLTQLEGLEKNLEQLQNSFDNFKAYHALKFFWQGLQKRQKASFQALASINPADWEACFTAWYLHQVLAHHEDEQIPTATTYQTSKQSFEQELKRLEKDLIGHTLAYWRGKQTQVVSQFHQQRAPLSIAGLYNLRLQHERQTPLRQIISTAPEVFMSFFPVLMVSPETCARLLPLHPKLFDVVIFDEASQLHLEDTLTASLRGKYVVIAGDQQQLPLNDALHQQSSSSTEQLLDDAYWNDATLKQEQLNYLANAASLLEYARSTGQYQERFLQIHYRSKHQDLIRFSNTVFYNQQLIPMATLNTQNSSNSALQWVAVNGTYQEGCNPAEAKAILEYLIQEVFPLSTYPSMGIICNTLAQRNLILQQLQQLQLENKTYQLAIQALLQKGLFVRYLEHVQGLERQIILFSGTFGATTDSNELPKTLPLIDHASSAQLLNVLATRAQEKLVVFNSIPKAVYLQYPNLVHQPRRLQRGLWWAYLAFIELASQHETAQEAYLLQQLEHINQDVYAVKPLPFKHQLYFQDELAQLIKTWLPDWNIVQNYNFQGLQLPLALFNTQQELKAAIIIDVAQQPASTTMSYAWDIFYKQYLNLQGIQRIRIWSKDWWQQLDQAKAQLQAKLQSITS